MIKFRKIDDCYGLLLFNKIIVIYHIFYPYSTVTRQGNGVTNRFYNYFAIGKYINTEHWLVYYIQIYKLSINYGIKRR